jgi:hypothetical protein
MVCSSNSRFIIYVSHLFPYSGTVVPEGVEEKGDIIHISFINRVYWRFRSPETFPCGRSPLYLDIQTSIKLATGTRALSGTATATATATAVATGSKIAI